MGRDFIVISAVSGCQQEDGITDCNHFAQSKDRASRKSLIPGEGSCSIRKGHTLIRNRKKKKVLVTTCLPRKASSADWLQLIEPLLLRFIRLWKTAKDRSIRGKGMRSQQQRQKARNQNTQSTPLHFFKLKVRLPQLSKSRKYKNAPKLAQETPSSCFLLCSTHDVQTLHYITVSPKLISIMPALSQATTSKVPLLLFCTYFYVFFYLTPEQHEEPGKWRRCCMQRFLLLLREFIL